MNEPQVLVSHEFYIWLILILYLSFQLWYTYLRIRKVSNAAFNTFNSLWIYYHWCILLCRRNCQQDPNLSMARLAVDSLFTNIPRVETIDICIDNLYNGNENPPNISNHGFRNLPNIATKESFFMFHNKYYKQVNGVAMGSPLASAFANT